MKFTLSWLKDHLDTDASLAEICERLTMIGLEVEAVDDRAVFAQHTPEYQAAWLEISLSSQTPSRVT